MKTNNRTIYEKEEDWQRIQEVAKARKVSPSEAIRSYFNKAHKRMKLGEK